MNAVSPDSLVALLERSGELPAAEIVRQLAVSQPTFSRLVSRAGDRIVRRGAARASRYAATRALGAAGSRWPLYRIDAVGRGHALGELIALARGEFHVAPARPLEALGLQATQLYPDLPWFLHDARPQGFIGRALARRAAAALDLPLDFELWNAEHTVRCWLTFGDDLPGELVLGEAAMQRLVHATLEAPAAIEAPARAGQYARCADSAMAGEAIGSSAGGEQPKFTACVRSENDQVRHVIVKFTEAQHSPAKRRWCDLLLAEHHALEVLRGAGLAAARSELVIAGERLCLEVERFDRVGAFGRLGLVSLRALAAEFDGAPGNWPAIAARLAREGWISVDDAERIRKLWWFGRLIANTDMHDGNVSFLVGVTRPLALAPAYDMLPMLYRPASNGEIVPRRFEPPLPLPEERACWLAMCGPATALWQRVAEDARVSLPFRDIARGNSESLQQLAARV